MSELLEDGSAHAVISSPVVAQCHHDHLSPAVVVHVRSTVTSRKCVAHEMHGSWLRTACSLLQVSSSSVRSNASLDGPTDIGLDHDLVLRRGGHDPRLSDGSLRVDAVAVEEETPRRLGARRCRNRRPPGPGRLGGPEARSVPRGPSASSQAKTSSTLRTTMLWNGLVHVGRGRPGRGLPATSGSWAELRA